MKKILLLGSGELGKEFVISAKRLGLYVVAADRYEGAPAMQLADESYTLNMLQAEDLKNLVGKVRPDIIVPEIEAIRTDALEHFEKMGIQVVPRAQATHLTMNRDAIRDFAASKLNLRTPQYLYATDLQELQDACEELGFPNVIKPVMSSSGKGQSVVKSPGQVGKAWQKALDGMRGDHPKVIVEEFISFDTEITLLTIRQKKGETIFVAPIGHRQERGDYQESWLPQKLSPKQLMEAQAMAKKITDHLGGYGLFGVEFFIRGREVFFSELSPRPHDTGMVTLISQNLSEFDLHLRALLGLPIPEIEYFGPSASAVILAKSEISKPGYQGLSKALTEPNTDIRLFGKPYATTHRRMGVALARGKTLDEARAKAQRSARAIRVVETL